MEKPVLLLSSLKKALSFPSPPWESPPYTSRDATKFLAKWSLFFEERRTGIPPQGDTIPPFTATWLWNFTGDGRNAGHSILLPPFLNITCGEENGERSWSGRNEWSVNEGLTQFLSAVSGDETADSWYCVPVKHSDSTMVTTRGGWHWLH